MNFQHCYLTGMQNEAPVHQRQHSIPAPNSIDQCEHEIQQSTSPIHLYNATSAHHQQYNAVSQYNNAAECMARNYQALPMQSNHHSPMMKQPEGVSSIYHSKHQGAYQALPNQMHPSQNLVTAHQHSAIMVQPFQGYPSLGNTTSSINTQCSDYCNTTYTMQQHVNAPHPHQSPHLHIHHSMSQSLGTESLSGVNMAYDPMMVYGYLPSPQSPINYYPQHNQLMQQPSQETYLFPNNVHRITDGICDGNHFELVNRQCNDSRVGFGNFILSHPLGADVNNMNMSIGRQMQKSRSSSRASILSCDTTFHSIDTIGQYPITSIPSNEESNIKNVSCLSLSDSKRLTSQEDIVTSNDTNCNTTKKNPEIFIGSPQRVLSVHEVTAGPEEVLSIVKGHGCNNVIDLTLHHQLKWENKRFVAVVLLGEGTYGQVYKCLDTLESKHEQVVDVHDGEKKEVLNNDKGPVSLSLSSGSPNGSHNYGISRSNSINDQNIRSIQSPSTICSDEPQQSCTFNTYSLSPASQTISLTCTNHEKYVDFLEVVAVEEKGKSTGYPLIDNTHEREPGDVSTANSILEEHDIIDPSVSATYPTTYSMTTRVTYVAVKVAQSDPSYRRSAMIESKVLQILLQAYKLHSVVHNERYQMIERLSKDQQEQKLSVDKHSVTWPEAMDALGEIDGNTDTHNSVKHKNVKGQSKHKKQNSEVIISTGGKSNTNSFKLEVSAGDDGGLYPVLSPTLPDPPFVQWIVTFEEQGKICIAFELLQETLLEYMKKRNFTALPVKCICYVARNLLEALTVLNSCGYMHCDINPKNVMLRGDKKAEAKGNNNINDTDNSVNCEQDTEDTTDNDECKSAVLIDFGAVRTFDENDYFDIQSLWYRAPEVLMHRPYSPKIDSWSVGCLLFELATGRPLFAGSDPSDQLMRIMKIMGGPSVGMQHSQVRGVSDAIKVKIDDPIHELHALEPKDLILHLLSLIYGLLDMNPITRLSSDEALSHPFFSTQHESRDHLRNKVQHQRTAVHAAAITATVMREEEKELEQRHQILNNIFPIHGNIIHNYSNITDSNSGNPNYMSVMPTVSSTPIQYITGNINAALLSGGRIPSSPVFTYNTNLNGLDHLVTPQHSNLGQLYPQLSPQLQLSPSHTTMIGASHGTGCSIDSSMGYATMASGVQQPPHLQGVIGQYYNGQLPLTQSEAVNQFHSNVASGIMGINPTL